MLGPGLANTVAVLQSKAHEKSVTVTLELEAELPKVRGYAGELNQVWGNLIDNALDAVANGGRVEVFAIRENQNVVVRIRDDGPGISPEIRDRVFDPFFTTKPQGQGTGLGLDIARRLVRHNDGVIDFESQPWTDGVSSQAADRGEPASRRCAIDRNFSCGCREDRGKPATITNRVAHRTAS